MAGAAGSQQRLVLGLAAAALLCATGVLGTPKQFIPVPEGSGQVVCTLHPDNQQNKATGHIGVEPDVESHAVVTLKGVETQKVCPGETHELQVRTGWRHGKSACFCFSARWCIINCPVEEG